MAYAELFVAVRDELSRALGLSAVWYLRIDESRSFYERIEKAGLIREAAQVTPLFQVKGDLLLEELVSDLKPIFIADARQDCRTNKYLVEKHLCRSMFLIPNHLEGNRLGVFGTGTYGDEKVRQLSRVERHYLQEVARHVAVVLSRIDRRIMEESIAESTTPKARRRTRPTGQRTITGPAVLDDTAQAPPFCPHCGQERKPQASRKVDATGGHKVTDGPPLATKEEILIFVDQAPVGIAMFDNQMNCLSASRRWTEGYGKGPSDRPGQNHYEVHPDFPEHWKAIHRRALAGESFKNDCELFVHPDGSKVWLSWAIYPWRDAQGRIGGVIMFGEQINHFVSLAKMTTDLQQRLAHDLHDTVSQELTALRMLTHVLGQSLGQPQEKLQALVGQINTGLNRGMQQLRDIMKGLAPVTIQADGLPASLQELAEEARQHGMADCRLECTGKPLALPNEVVATQLYMIAREAVHNALKHGDASEIQVGLHMDKELALRIRNQTEKPQETKVSKYASLGRKIMMNRATVIGAKLEFEPLKPGGLQVTCRLEGLYDGY